MKPLKFPEQNVVYAENQPEYIPLPAYRKVETGEVVFCMGLSFKERIKLLFTGKVWVSLLTFGGPLTPSFLTTDKSELIQ